ncbi:hypothetical protein [Dyella japonica]|nr:hypothetical protein [Dyella japonica]
MFLPMSLDAGDGLVILLLGPTQCGKSILFHEVVHALKAAFLDNRPGAIPIAALQIETVGDGRAKPKWLGLELLKELRHPIYEHIGDLDEHDHYFPSKGRDEGTMRVALKAALNGRYTRRVCLDEVHLLTRTKDPELRAAILESVKCTCAIDRTLIASGGYEIAYKGLFDSSHFSGRVVTIDFGNYESSRKEDVCDWVRILKTYGQHLKLTPETLLFDEFESLMVMTNGVVGLLDKMLWRAQITAASKNSPIDRAILFSCAPPANEQASIAKDIQKGKAAIALATGLTKRAETGDNKEVTKVNAGQGLKPFERRPDRNSAMEISIHDDD